MTAQAFISYLPLIGLIAFLSGCAFMLWRSEFNIGALMVQIVTAAFLSTLAGYALWVFGVIMVVSALFPQNDLAWRANLIIGMSAGATIGYSFVKRHGTSSESITVTDVAISLALGAVGAIIGFVLFLDVQFGADFVPNASDVSGAYFGALIGGNLPLIVAGIRNVMQHREP